MNEFRQHPRWIIAVITVVITGLACAIPGLPGNDQSVAKNRRGPVVTLSSPVAGQSLEPDSEVKVQSTSVDAVGIARVELLIDGQVTWVDANPQPQPNAPYIVAQPWTPDTPGPHVIRVRAYNTDNVPGESEPVVVEVVTPAQAASPGSPPAADEAEVSVATGTPALLGQPVTSPTVTRLPLPTTLPETAVATTRPTSNATPTSTPTPGTFDPTAIEPEGRFREIWLELGNGDSRLGYPIDVEITGRNFAKQYFERGLMYWWDNPAGPGYIWVIDSPATGLKGGATWNRYPDTWEGGDEYSCDEARSNAEKGPVRGFGKLWCERPELQNRLGRPSEREAGSGGNPPYGRVQFYQGGLMLYNPLNSEVFVLFNQGDWLRFGYEKF